MALEAVVFPQASHFGYGPMDYALPWCDPAGFAGEWEQGLLASVAPDADEWETVSVTATQDHSSKDSAEGKRAGSKPAAAGRRKRRRNRIVKDKEEMETQRMTHIAVERNRRRQMNEYLAVLRSLMPPSYAHRGDQASIVGGAINYVRELEQRLQSLQVRRSAKNRAGCRSADANQSSPFPGFFTFPQYSTSAQSHGGCGASSCSSNTSNVVSNNGDAAGGSSADRCHRQEAVADIEVTVVEGHASLKVLAPRRPKQLLRLVDGLQRLRVPPLHLNLTSVHAMVLYTFSLKVEDDSQMGSAEDIATAVHEILSSVQEQEETAVM